MKNNLYCSVFIDSDRSEADISHLIVTRVQGTENHFSEISCSWSEISLLKNPDANSKGTSKIEDADFLFYPYKLEIYPVENISRDTYIEHLGQLLETFWAKDMFAVAMCNFEDELPRKGGYADSVDRHRQK